MGFGHHSNVPSRLMAVRFSQEDPLKMTIRTVLALSVMSVAFAACGGSTPAAEAPAASAAPSAEAAPADAPVADAAKDEAAPAADAKKAE